MSTRGSAWSTRLTTAVVSCAVLVLGGCGDETVDRLTADRVASTTPDGARLVGGEDEAESGGLLGKPSPADTDPAFPPAPGIFVSLRSPDD